MRVLVFAPGADTGGQGYRIADAFARLKPGWQVDERHMTNPLGYPEMVRMRTREKTQDAHRLYDAADVVHLRNDLRPWQRWDDGQGKPTILHHHGSMFRMQHANVSAIARRAGIVQVASTLDLAMLEPDVEWLPSPYNLEELAAIRAEKYRPSDRIRIAYFPTSPRIKSTGAFMAAITGLMREYSIELLTNVRRSRPWHWPWARVIDMKARADIYFDQVILGYGNNAVEAWAMGIPVVAGVEDQRVREEMLRRFGALPFVESTEAGIADTLRLLIESHQMRAEYGELGLEHARRFHAESVVVDQLSDLWRNAPPTTPVSAQVPSPRTFRARAAA